MDLNSLVFGWLCSAAPKLASKFQKEQKCEPLAPGSPSLKELVDHYVATTPQKRKTEAAKVATPKAAPAKPAAAAKKAESSSEDDSSDEEEEVKKPAAKPAASTPKVAAKKEESSSDDSSDDEVEAKPVAKKATKMTKMTDSEKQEWTKAAKELILSGKRHLLVSYIPAAVSDLAEWADLFSKVFSEFSVGKAELFLNLGKSLLAVSRLESGVLGNVLQGVDVGGEDGTVVEDGQVEDHEKMSKDEQLEVEEKVAGWRCRLEVEEKVAGWRCRLKVEEKVAGRLDLALEVNFEKDEDEDEEDSAMEEGVSQDESEAEGTEDKMETEGKMETDKSTDNEVESEEEPGNLQQAWWMLEVAKNGFIKRASESMVEAKRKEAEIKTAEALLALGEVSLENEHYELSAAYLFRCLGMRMKIFPADSRSIAETFYQLGVAHAFGAKYPESEASFNSAIGVLEARVKNLGAMEASDNIVQEIRDLEALVKDVKDKIVDHKDMEKGIYVDKEAAGFTGASDGGASAKKSVGAKKPVASKKPAGVKKGGAAGAKMGTAKGKSAGVKKVLKKKM